VWSFEPDGTFVCKIGMYVQVEKWRLRDCIICRIMIDGLFGCLGSIG